MSRLSRNSTLSAENANPDNWEWKGESGDIWQPALEHWQEFRAKWYGATGSQSASLVDPKSPSLSLESLPRGIDSSISSSIFIPKSYVTMFDTVWARAMAMRGKHGVIITGQSGTGKTLFNYYLLVRLLQRKQIVLFSPKGKVVYLWYFNGVYKTTMRALAAQGEDASLPNPIPTSHGFIWSLFDIREPKEPAMPLVTFPCFPVQTASPNPIRYQIWEKERIPLFTAMPLWTRDELAQGLRYQDEYHFLLDVLGKVYTSNGSLGFSEEYLYSGVRALLEERYSEEDTVPPSPEDAIDYLLDAAIDRFGYSARDVFYGVFDYSGMTRRHEDAFNLKYTELQAAASALAHNQSADSSISDWVLALFPVEQDPLRHVSWDVDFKSDWVARNVIQKLGETEYTVIRQHISVFRKIPQTRRLADRFLEPIAHRYIANATGGFWLLTNMKPNAADPPIFNLVRGSPVPDDVRFIKVKRKIVKFQSIADLLTCLGNNTYYIPEDPSFPLFDAFTVELDHEKKQAILWVLQMAMSRRHGGSALGYRKIREIIAILKDKLREDPPRKKSKMVNGHATSMPCVQVRYLLVVPKGDPEFQNLHWQFPKGWSQNRNKNDHSGNVYCLEVTL